MLSTSLKGFLNDKPLLKGHIKTQYESGKDGITPHIGENGNWFIGEEDTGVRAEGLSAYELAVKNGFKGTEEEWLESLKAPVASVKMFGAIGDGIADDTEAIKNALMSDYAEIAFEPGQYKITSTIRIENSGVRSIDGCNSTILTGSMEGSNHAFLFYKPVDVKNLNFDCENSNLKSAVTMINTTADNSEIVNLSNVSVKNLRDTVTQSGSNLISVQGFRFEINQCHFSDCKKAGNGTISDGGGNLTAIWLRASDYNAAIGRVHNCSFKNMSNIDQNGNITYEDVSCIYVANFVPSSTDPSGWEVLNGDTTTVIIDNITGFNYGKRLIKTQTNNVHISNIDAYSEIDGPLSAIGVLEGHNATIDGVIVRGKSVLPIVSLAENSVISNCIIESSIDMIPDGYGDVSAGITVSKNAIISNCVIKNTQIGISIGNTEDVLITSCNWESNEEVIMGRNTNFIFLSNNHGVKNLVLKDNVLKGFKIVQTYANTSVDRSNIILENNTIYGKGNVVRFEFNDIKNLKVKNHWFYDEGNTSRYVSAVRCENITVDGITAFETDMASTHSMVYLQDCYGEIIVKNIRQPKENHKRYLWMKTNSGFTNPITKLEVEIFDPKRYRFENCVVTSVRMTPVVVNTVSDLESASLMVEGMLFYIVNEAALKQVKNGNYIDLISISNVLGGIENGTY